MSEVPPEKGTRELETEEQKTRQEIAGYLRGLADQLDQPGAVRLELGGKQVSLDPGDPITFKLEAESDWSPGEDQAKQSIEFELVWRRNVNSPEEGFLQVSDSTT